jgi:hypothetical protein
MGKASSHRTRSLWLLNVIFGGLIGLGVDSASGAMYKYPDMVTVMMTPDYPLPDPACRNVGRPPVYIPPPPGKHTSSL